MSELPDHLKYKPGDKVDVVTEATAHFGGKVMPDAPDATNWDKLLNGVPELGQLSIAITYRPSGYERWTAASGSSASFGNTLQDALDGLATEELAKDQRRS
jgi:hypothetical protein